VKAPEESKIAKKLVVGAALGFGLCVALLMRKTDHTLTSANSSTSSANAISPASTIQEAEAPASSSTAVDPTVQPAAIRTAEDLVRLSVGRWRGDDGTVVEVDPVRPRIGARPPFHLIIAKTEKEKRIVFGCDFTDAETVKKPPDQSERTYRAWCGGDGKGKRAALGLTLDAGLSVSLMVDGEWKLTATGLAKQRLSPAPSASAP